MTTPLPRKLLIFAHVPPPHHGQAVMVELMLAGLRSDPQFEVHHVDARVSDDIGDVGGIRVGKVFRLIGYCLEAIRLRLRHGAMDFYYVPAPAKKSAIVRDWVVMLLVRPWFRRTIFHWHAFGLGHWATGTTEYPSGDAKNPRQPPRVFGALDPLARWLTRWLLGKAALSIVLTDYNRRDADLLLPRQISIVPNGIPDPCPDFETSVLPERQHRLATRKSRPMPYPEPQDPSYPGVQLFRVLFLAHCTREKGLFDTLDAVAFANSALANQNSPLRIHLTVAGEFMNDIERKEFDARITQPDLHLHLREEFPRLLNLCFPRASPAVSYAGFVSGKKKSHLLRDCDCLCFPTYYQGETFGVTIIEALAYGLPVLVSEWRGLPGLVPESLKTTPMRDPQALSAALISLPDFSAFSELQQTFNSCYDIAPHAKRLTQALFHSPEELSGQP